MIETKDDIVETIDWVVACIRNKDRFGFPEEQAVYRRETRAKSVLRDCKEFITELDQAYSIAIEGLKKIAGQDFRGNRPNECVLAYETLKKLGEV